MHQLTGNRRENKLGDEDEQTDVLAWVVLCLCVVVVLVLLANVARGRA